MWVGNILTTLIENSTKETLINNVNINIF